MKKIKVMTVFGTRPEAYKMAPLIKVLEACAHTELTVCVTAQHREMLDAGLEVFKIKPDIDLNIMKHNQSHADIIVNAITGLTGALASVGPDICLVHGDTLTTFVASLACFYQNVKVGHVEAGLRTGDKYAPFPEEINRRLTGVLADLHFAPTELAKKNLLKETVPEEFVFVTGNTALDVVKSTVSAGHVFEFNALNDFDYKSGRMILMTAHRKENIGKGIENICRAVLRIVENYADVTVIYPVHLNPKVRETVFPMLRNHKRIILTEPVNIIDLHNLINRSYMVMSDSGGIQEEAPYFKKPMLVMREVTERPEGVDTGALRLVGVDENNIYENARELLDSGEAYLKMAKAKNPFGDGFASERILNSILYYFKIISERPGEFIYT